MVLKERVKEQKKPVAVAPRTEVPGVFEKGMKGNKGFLFVGIGVLVVALIAGLVFWLGSREASPKISTQDQNTINQVWGGKAPNAAEEKRIVDKVMNSPWPPPNPFLTAPVTAPVVIPPSAKSDFKVEYRETLSAKGKIDVRISSTKDPRVKTVRIENRTNQPLLIKQFHEEKDASGKILDSSESVEWYKMDPRYVINDTESPGFERAKSIMFWVEVKNAE